MRLSTVTMMNDMIFAYYLVHMNHLLLHLGRFPPWPWCPHSCGDVVITTGDQDKQTLPQGTPLVSLIAMADDMSQARSEGRGRRNQISRRPHTLPRPGRAPVTTS